MWLAPAFSRAGISCWALLFSKGISLCLIQRQTKKDTDCSSLLSTGIFWTVSLLGWIETYFCGFCFCWEFWSFFFPCQKWAAFMAFDNQLDFLKCFLNDLFIFLADLFYVFSMQRCKRVQCGENNIISPHVPITQLQLLLMFWQFINIAQFFINFLTELCA